MSQKLNQTLDYLLSQLGEASTWQGIGFVVGLLGSRHVVGLDWGQAAGIGGTISATIKMVLPDGLKVKKGD